MKQFISSLALLGLFSLPIISVADEASQLSSIVLKNGDTLNAEVIKQNDKEIVIKHPELGQITIPTDKVKTLTTPQQLLAEKAKKEAEKTQAAKTPEKPEDQGLFNTGFMKDWKRNFSVGLAGSSGESNSQQGNADFTSTYEDDDTRMGAKLYYFRASSDSEVTDNAFYSTFNKDWLFQGSPWFYFANGRLDWDDFQPWDWRISANTGPGYDFIKSDAWLVSGRGGVGFSKTYGDQDQDFVPEGVLGLDVKWKVDDRNHIEFTNNFYPSFKNTDDYRNLATLDWVLALNTLHNANLKLGLRDEYDSTNNDEDVDNNNFKYTLSIGWDL